jgi:hypothetical protein
VDFTVEPGTFGGTITPATANWGETITISAAEGTFDSDTEVTFDGLIPYLISFDESSEFVVVGPAGMGGSPSTILITGAGTDQLAFTATIEVPNPDPNDANEPNNDFATATPATLPFEEYISQGNLDIADVFQITLAAETTIDFLLDWNYTDVDMDIYVYDSGGSDTGEYGCATGAVPESCSITLAAGTYYIESYVWDMHGVSEWVTLQFTMTPQ